MSFVVLPLTCHERVGPAGWMDPTRPVFLCLPCGQKHYHEAHIAAATVPTMFLGWACLWKRILIAKRKWAPGHERQGWVGSKVEVPDERKERWTCGSVLGQRKVQIDDILRRHSDRIYLPAKATIGRGGTVQLSEWPPPSRFSIVTKWPAPSQPSQTLASGVSLSGPC